MPRDGGVELDQMRAVVLIPDGDPGWGLPPAVPTDHGWLGGGRQTMHELAVAIACTGTDVEMRGEVDVAALEELSAAAGARPDLPDRPRAPAASDVVFVYEGVEDPALYARLALSPARVVLMLLAPPGLFGWPFAAGWSRPDPLTVDPDSVARPEHFQGAAALGFELWTNSRGLHAAAERAGVSCRFVGRGLPGALPAAPTGKDIDVIAVGHNRWAPLANRVVKELEGLGVESVRPPRARHRDLLEMLGRARVLVHPMRVEGNSRLSFEARAAGAVPVVLGTNPYTTDLDEANGAVSVGSVSEMAAAVTGLLGDPDRLGRLAAAGMRWARREVAWKPYVERVGAALAAGRPDAGRDARAVMGAALRATEGGNAERAAQLERALVAAQSDLEQHRRWLESTNASISWRVTRPLRAAKRALRRR
jgi:hypothetical protein